MIGSWVAVVVGVAWTVGSIAIVVAIAERGRTGVPALFVVFGPSLVYYGGVESRRELRVLAADGVRRTLVPMVQQRPASRFSIFRHPRLDVRTETFLAVTDDAGAELLIPVTRDLARRALPSTAAIVRGDLRPGGRVLLDFPHELVWPTGTLLSSTRPRQ